MAYLIPFSKAFLALFIILDPLGNLPFFMGLTEGMTNEDRRKVFRLAEVTAIFILLLFVIAGSLILDLFKITLNDFKIAGGLLLFIIAVEMLLRGKMTVEHKEDVGAFPLGCPLLVGPGAITTAMVFLGNYGFIITFSAIILNFIVIWLILRYATQIYSILGQNGAKIISRLVSILLAAIAVQFIREGIQAIFKL